MDNALIEKMLIRAGTADCWKPDTIVIPADEVEFVVRQHQAEQLQERLSALRDAIQSLNRVGSNSICSTFQSADERAYDRAVQNCKAAIGKLIITAMGDAAVRLTADRGHSEQAVRDGAASSASDSPSGYSDTISEKQTQPVKKDNNEGDSMKSSEYSEQQTEQDRWCKEAKAFARECLGDSPSEICDNEEEAWQAINKILVNWNYIGTGRTHLADELWESIRPYLRTTKPMTTGEISVVEDNALEIAEKAYNDWCDETEEVAGASYCHEVPLRVAIDAYLKVIKPVSSKVSLEKCLHAYFEAMDVGHTPKDIVAIILKAAGVKYAN